MKLLLERKEVNPDSPNKWGEIPLCLAAEGGHEGIVKLLLERKEVNPDSPNKWGEIPLCLAAEGGHEGIVKLLLERKEVNPESSSEDGKTPLFWASGRNGLGARAAPRGSCQEEWTGPDNNFYSVPSWHILGLQGLSKDHRVYGSALQIP